MFTTWGPRELLQGVDLHRVDPQLPVDLLDLVLALLADGVEIDRFIRSTGLAYQVEILKVLEDYGVASMLRHEIRRIHLPRSLEHWHTFTGCLLLKPSI